MKLSSRTQLFLLCTFLFVCGAVGPATMPVWRNAWSTNRPPMSVEGNNDLEVTNIPGKLAWRFYAGSTNTVARKVDTSNDVAVTAGANITVTPSGAAGRMSYAVASAGGGSGVSTNPTQFGASSQLTLKSGAFQTNANFWGSGTNHGDFDLESGAYQINGQNVLNDVGGGELAIGGSFSLLDSPNIRINGQDALVDIGGGVLGVGTGLGGPFAAIKTPTVVNIGAIAPALQDDGAGNLLVGDNTGTFTTFLEGVNIFSDSTHLFNNDAEPFADDSWSLGIAARRWQFFFVSRKIINDGFSVLSGPVTNKSTVNLPTNNAPVTTIAPANLHNVALGKGWTNDLGARADLVLSVKLTDSVTGDPALAFTNSITGEAWTNNLVFGAVASVQYTIVIPDLSPSDRGSFTDLSGAGAAVTILKAWWKLK